MNSTSTQKLSAIAGSGATLAAFQIAGLIIPLLTLPVLARALGVAEFGRVMLAQAIVFFGVVFVDAGFNTESQRRVAIATDELQKTQALIDNLLTRIICSLPVMVVIIIFSILFDQIPHLYVVVALLHILGTLLFPQWWLISQGQGLRLGIALVCGRLFSAAFIIAFVHGPQDGLIATAAASSGTVVAGLLVLPIFWKHWQLHRHVLNTKLWRNYFRAVRPTVLSGFFSSSTASIPAVFLGWGSGVSQVGLFTAADRLTRSVAHVVGSIEQAFIGPLVQANASHAQAAQVLRLNVLLTFGLAMGLGCLVAGYLAPTIISVIYGNSFAHVVPLFRLLCVWLWFFVMRRASLLFTWSSQGNLAAVSRFQWLEAFVTTASVGIGVVCNGAMGLCIALIASEALLSFLLWLLLRQRKRAA
jgi:O-antigen/teichoic acid export membrane protein